MWFHSGRNWVADFFRRRGWLVRRRLKPRRRPWHPLSAFTAECLEQRTLPATITVTTLNDEVTTDGQVSLREAIEAANTGTSVDGSVAGDAGVTNTIVFAAGLTGTISLDAALGEMTISSSMIIEGLGATNTLIDAQQNSRIFDITSGAGDVTLQGMTLENGKTTVAGRSSAGGAGGAIFSASKGTLSLSGDVVSGNSTTGNQASGGAIFAAGPVTIVNSIVSGNSTSASNQAYGGAIYSASAVTVLASTLSGNSTSGIHSYGGALFAFGDVQLTNSTVTGNRTTGPGSNAGAVWIGSALTAINSTIAQNSASNGQGGSIYQWIFDPHPVVTLKNSIVAENTDNGTAPDLSLINTATVTVTHSLIGDNTGTLLTAAPVGSPDANGNLIGTAGALIDPMLGALANNGGPTLTMALQAGSPAINAGSNSLAVDPSTNTPLAYDERGTPFLRIMGSAVDMGAYEFSPTVSASTAPLPANASSVTINGAGFDATAANNSVVVEDITTGISITVTPATASTTSLAVSLAGIGTLTAGDVLTVVVTTSSVGSGTPVQVATVAPVVTPNLSNALLPLSTSLTLSGLGFDPAKANDSVTLTDGNGHVISNTISSASSTSLTITVTGPLTGGTLYATLNANGESSGTAVQVATVTPVVTSSTASLPAGASSITIAGSGFDATAANNSVVVQDAATGTTITVTPVTASATSLTVPLTAIGTLTAGDVLTAVVTTNSVGSGTPAQVATIAPVVTPNLSNALLPGSTSLTLGGSGFDPTKANDSVTLTDGNGHVISNTISSASATSLTITATGPLTGGTLYASLSANGVSSGTAIQVATVTPVVTGSTAPLPADASSLTISGSGFDANSANNSVLVEDATTGTSITVTPVTASGTSLTVPLAGIGTLTAGDVLTTVVTTNGLGSGTPVQVATVMPVVTPNLSNALLPGSTSLTLGGSGFEPTKSNDSVTLTDGNGHVISNTISSGSGTSLTIALTGPLTGGTLYASLSANGVSSGTAIQVATVTPVVTGSTAPLPAGASSITIAGSGFDATAANNSVVIRDTTTGTSITVTPITAGATSLTVPLTGIGTLTAGDVLTAVVTANGVSSGTAVQVATITPVVTGSTASLAANANTVQIAGFGFDPAANHNQIVFNDGAVGTVSAASATLLTVTFSTRPLHFGSLTAVITTNGVSTGTPVQVATVGPAVTASTSLLAANAATITIHGFGFSPIARQNVVVFNDGAVGTVIAATKTALVVRFVTRPTTAGSLTAMVTTNGSSSGTAIEVGTVRPVVATSAARLSHTATTMTIHGLGFDPTPANNTVSFSNGAVGIVTGATATSLTITFTSRPTRLGRMTAHVVTNGIDSGVAVRVATVL